MPGFENLRIDFRAPEPTHDDVLVEAGRSLNREAQMILSGVGRAGLETVTHPTGKLPELTTAVATGAAFGALSRLGAPGRAIAGGIGTAMMLKFGYDELSGRRWSNFGSALKETWRSPDNLEQSIEATKNSLGSFLVDSGIGFAGMKAGSVATARWAPCSRLMKDALVRADSDGGAAVLNLQNRWENPGQFQKCVAGKLELATHNQALVPGEARGDLLRVASTPDGKILLSAMDVEGHGLSAARKAVQVHAAIDQVLPQTAGKNASDILSMVDKKLGGEEKAITAGMMTYDPVSHELQAATASGELAYLIKSSGAVSQVDASGMSLGLGWYNEYPRGKVAIKLEKGDTVIMASDGVFDRFARGNWGGLPESTLSLPGFKAFLEKMGPVPKEIARGILNTPPPKTGVDDASFIVFRRL
jgi:hypothetical protein